MSQDKSTPRVAVRRDVFGRWSLTREVVAYPRRTCDWCGGRRPSGSLFRYVVEHDGGRVMKDDHLFCGISCYDSWHA